MPLSRSKGLAMSGAPAFSNQVKTVWEDRAPGFLKTSVVVTVPPTLPSCLTLSVLFTAGYIFLVCSGSTLPSHHVGFFLWWLIRLHAGLSDSLETVSSWSCQEMQNSSVTRLRLEPLLTRCLLTPELPLGCRMQLTSAVPFSRRWQVWVWRSPGHIFLFMLCLQLHVIIITLYLSYSFHGDSVG